MGGDFIFIDRKFFNRIDSSISMEPPELNISNSNNKLNDDFKSNDISVIERERAKAKDKKTIDDFESNDTSVKILERANEQKNREEEKEKNISKRVEDIF